MTAPRPLQDFPAKMARAREAAQQGKGRAGQNGKAGKAAAAEDPPVNGDASPRTVLQVLVVDADRGNGITAVIQDLLLSYDSCSQDLLVACRSSHSTWSGSLLWRMCDERCCTE